MHGSGYDTKLSVQSSLNKLGDTRAAEQIQNTGRVLPCKVIAVAGPIVTVSFQVKSPQTLQPMIMPIAEPQWCRLPVQVGDLGITIPADTFLGGISGLGSGLADITVNYGNLSTLAFLPVGNNTWPTAPDPNRIWLNGPNGMDATDTAQTGGIRYDKATGTVTIFAGSQTIVITTDPSITVTVIGAEGTCQRIVDGAAGTISDIPSVLQALGAPASELIGDATRAVAANNDIKEVINGGNGVLGNMLPLLMAAVGNAIGTASPTWSTAQAALQVAFTASTFVSDIPGIEAVIPSCSSLVRVVS